MSELEVRAVRKLIEQADEMGLGDQVPDRVLEIAMGNVPSNGGAIAWANLHPDEEDWPFGCCVGNDLNGPEYCRCWEPVYDLPQGDLQVVAGPLDCEVQTGLCGDCAYRKDSPERSCGDRFMEDTLIELTSSGRDVFFCHEGYDVPARVGRWILLRLLPLLTSDRRDDSFAPTWESVSNTVGAGIKKAMAELAAEAARFSSTVSHTTSPTEPTYLPAWWSCIVAITPPASRSDISSPEQSLRTTLTWLRRGGLSADSARAITTANSPTNRLLISVADALLAKRCNPSLTTSESITPTSVDSPERCDALFDRMRRPVRWEHPDGRVVDGDPADYQPPMVAGVPYRADGRPGLICGGWDARAQRIRQAGGRSE